MITQLVIKNDEEKVFTLDFPQVKNGCEMPKKMLLNYDEKSRKCESFMSYEDIAVHMNFNHEHKPTHNGWIQTYVNNNLTSGKSDEASIQNSSKNPDKDADLYTILDPEDFDHSMIKPVDEFINLEGFENYCYHPDIKHRIYKKKNKEDTQIIIKVSKIPKTVKQFYYEHIMKTNPPKNRVKNAKSTGQNVEDVFNYDLVKNDWMKLEIAKFQKHLKKCSINYTKIDFKCLIEFIRLEKTFNNQYKTEDMYSAVENKNFNFTKGVPKDWESYTLWSKDENLMMDIIHDEKYEILNTNVETTYDAWKKLVLYNIKFPCDEISRSFIKQELIRKLIPSPPGISTKEGINMLNFNENFLDYNDMIPSTPGPGKIQNDPTNGDLNSFVNNQKSIRYQMGEDWIDIMTFVPEQVRKMDPYDTPVVVYLTTGQGDYFHYYNGNKGRRDHFSNPAMDFYNKNCVIFSLDYYVPSDNKKKFYINPNKELLKMILGHISERYTNKNLRFLAGHSRGAQSAFFAHIENPEFTNRVFLSELYISDNPYTIFDEERAKFLMKHMPKQSSVITVNGLSNYYRSQPFESFTAKHENFDLQMIEGYGTGCHQYGIMELFKPEIEMIWRQQMEQKMQ